MPYSIYTKKNILAILKFGSCMLLAVLLLTVFSGCVSHAAQKQPPASEIAAQIMNSVQLPEMIRLDDKKLQRFYGISPDTLEEYSVYISSTNIHADELAVLKVKDPAGISDIRAKISARLEQQTNSFKDYLPDEYYLLQKYVLKQEGNYILFVVSKDAARMGDIFEKQF